MKVLFRNRGIKNWKLAESVKPRGEIELQSLIADSPSLIPVNEINDEVSPLIFAVREFGLPGSGNTDILAFSGSGDIAIIECKLATNSESKRKVIGQILEYAAYLWGMSYEEVNERVQKSKCRNLADLVAEAIKDEAISQGFDEEDFRVEVRNRLETGSFILIIVVDEINEELRRIIRYVNECSKSSFSLHALELRRFHSDGVEILLPHLHGASLRPSTIQRRKQWTEEEFFRVLGEKVEPEISNIIKDIYEWGDKVANRIFFGTGLETGSFTFHFLKDGKTISVFSINTYGYITLNYGWLSTQIEKEILQEFHRLITRIPSFMRIPSDFSRWPNVKVSDAFLGKPEAIEEFKKAVVWLGEKARG